MADIPKFESAEVIREKVQPGDIIEFNRVTYSHSALYMGDGMLMNVWADEVTSKEAKVQFLTLDEVLLDSHIRIRNYQDIAKQIFNLEPRPINEIKEHAKVFQDTTVEYEFLFRNCEYFVTLWRYGKGFSLQGAILPEGLFPDSKSEQQVNLRHLPHHLPDFYLKTPKQNYEKYIELDCACSFCAKGVKDQ